jgi:membrane fusion protein (multidrug efflux system)
MFHILNPLWLKLSHTNRKTIKILSFFCLALFVFFVSKSVITNFFIQKFLKTPPIVQVMQVKPKVWEKNYHSVGQLKATKTVNISSQAAGTIKNIHIHPNQEIPKGHLILELEHQVESARVKLQTADFKLQKSLFNQQKILFDKKLISYTQFIQAKNNLQRTKALLKEANAQLGQKFIYAPFSGVLGIPEVQVGEYITPGQQHVITLQKLNHLYLDFYLPEKFYKNVERGTLIRFKTNQEKQFRHFAKIIAIQPVSEQQAHTIWVRAKINNIIKQFIPGLFVHLEIPIKKIQHAISIPSRSILGSSDGPIVFIAEEKNNPDTKKKNWWITKRNIKIDLAKNQNTLILSGLHENEFIVLSGTQKVHDKSWAMSSLKQVS